MASESVSVRSGLTLAGTFAGLDQRTFTGSDGQPVVLVTVKVHDAEGLAYHEVQGIKEDAAILMPLAGLAVGAPLALRVGVSKSGKLKPITVLN